MDFTVILNQILDAIKGIDFAQVFEAIRTFIEGFIK